MSASFFSLPVEVFQGPVLSFLTAICLSQLDCAVANRFLRRELFEYFEHAVVKNEHEEHVFRLDICSMKWLLSRNLYFTNFVIVDSGLREHCDALSSVVVRAARVDCGFEEWCGDYIVRMLQNCEQLRSFSICGDDGFTDSALVAITTQHSQLTELNIASCEDLTSQALQSIARNCTSLERLDVGSNGHFDANHVTHMLCRLPNLRWLDVTTADFQAHHWEMIFDNCSLLEHINISFTNFTAETLAYMGQQCPLITSVAMHTEGSDSRLAALALALPGLLELGLQGSYELSSTGMVAVARQCKGLRKLDLSTCSEVTNEGLIALAQNCPELTHLDCLCAGYHTTDDAIILLAQGCTKLESIVVPFSEAITNASILALAHNCPQLETFHMLNGKSIADAGLIPLFIHSIHLRYLTLGYSQLTDKTLLSLAAIFIYYYWKWLPAANLPNLWELTLRECKKIKSAGLAALAKRCKNLALLKVDGCVKVGDAEVIAVVQHCRRLRTLELTGLPAVTNAFVDVCIAEKVRAKISIAQTGVTAEKKAELGLYLLGK